MAAGIGGKVTVTAGTNMEEVAELIETATESRSRCRAFEAAHRPGPAFRPTRVLFNPVVQISVGPVPYAFARPSPVGIARG